MKYESMFLNPSVLRYNAARRLDEERTSDTAFHCLSQGVINGTLLTMSKDKSVAYMMRYSSIVAVYRSDYLEIHELSDLHGKTFKMEE